MNSIKKYMISFSAAVKQNITRISYFISSILLFVLVFSQFFQIITNKQFYYPTKVLVEISSESDASLQLLYDTGKGFSETSSITNKITKEKKTLSFKLPPQKLSAIRLELHADKDSIVHVYNIEIKNHKSSVGVVPKNIENYFSVHDGDGYIDGDGDRYTFIVGDEVLYLSGNIALSEKMVYTPKYKYLLFHLLIITFIFCFLLISTFYDSLLHKIKDKVDSILQQFTNCIPVESKVFKVLAFPAVVAVTIVCLVMLLSGNGLLLIKNSSVSTIVYSIRITVSIMLLAIVGISLSGLLKIKLWFSKNHRALYPIHSIFVAITVLMIYVYVRSLINQLINLVIPVTIFELSAISLFVIVMYVKNTGMKELRNAFERNAGNLVPVVILLFSCIFVFVAREIPRITSLSSDPSVHAFITNQLLSFGTVFFNHQSYWGTTGFNYPTGLHVLSFIFARFTGLNATNAIGIIVQIQFVLALLLVFELFVDKTNNLRSVNSISFLLTVVVFSLVFLYYPYGYEPNHFHLEGTGRMASIFGFSILVSYVLSSFGNKNDKTNLTVELLSVFLIMYFLMVINPINIFVSFLLIIVVVFLKLVLYKKTICWKQFFILFIVVVISTLSFPEVYNSITQLIKNEIIRTSTKHELVSITHIISLFLSPLKKFSFVSDIYSIFSLIGVFGKFQIVMMVVCYIAFLFQQITNYIANRSIKTSAIIMSLFPFMCVVLYILVQGLAVVTESLHLLSTSYLMVSYVGYSLFQVVYIWSLVMLYSILSKINHKSIVVLSLLIVIFNNIRGYTPDVKRFYRKHYQGSLGTISENDITVIQKIKHHFDNYKNKNSNLFYATVPKILYPCQPLGNFNSSESWLFLSPAEQYLAVSNAYPVAFYFSSGSGHFTGSDNSSYETYRDYIYEKLDYDFIVKNNIKYMFISEDYGQYISKGEFAKITISDFEKIMNSSRIIEKCGNAYFIEIL